MSQNQSLEKKVNQTAKDIARGNHFQKQLIQTNPFMLTTFQKFSNQTKNHFQKTLCRKDQKRSPAVFFS